MNSLSELANCIRSNDNFVLTGHTNPDGDCIGSLIGLYLGLQNLGKKADVILQDPVPEIYSYLSGVKNILHTRPENAMWENVIFLDCSDAERAGKQILSAVQDVPYRICLDHHISNEEFADMNYVDSNASATAELVFELLGLMDVEIDEQIANALYAGLVQDTGNFRHASTSSHSFRIAAELLEHGASIENTKLHLFESKSQKEVLLLANAMGSLTFSENGQLAWMTIQALDAAALQANDFFPEGIINYTLLAKDVKVGILFREIDEHSVKVGFRSKGEVNVAAIAEQLGGGGHRQASGAHVDKPLLQVKEMVFSIIKDVM